MTKTKYADELTWVKAGSNRKLKSMPPLLHIKDIDADLEPYERGQPRMRTLCGVEDASRTPVSSIRGYRLCQFCLIAAGI